MADVDVNKGTMMANAIAVYFRCFEKDPFKGAEVRIQQHSVWLVSVVAPVVANSTEVHVIVDFIGTEECIHDAADEFVREG